MSHSHPHKDDVIPEPTESPIPIAAEPEFAKDTFSALLADLRETEKQALDVTPTVEQIMKLSNQNQYAQTVTMILNDSALSTEAKLRLKAEEDERQEHKTDHAVQYITQLQDSQSDNLAKILLANGIKVVFVVSVVWLCGTKSGRVLLYKAGRWLATEGPQLVQQLTR